MTQTRTFSEEETLGLLNYCETIEEGHFSDSGQCYGVRLNEDAFFQLMSQTIIFEALVHSLFGGISGSEAEIVVALSPEESSLANRIAAYFIAQATEKTRHSSGLYVASIVGARRETLLSAQSVQIMTAVFDQGKLRPRIEVEGKRVAIVMGFLTDGKALAEAKEALQGAIIVSKAAICAYDFSEEEIERLGVKTLLCIQLIKVPTKECPFCNSQ